MKNRRTFIKKIAAGSLAAGLIPLFNKQVKAKPVSTNLSKFPIVLSTWNHRIAANEEAWKTLSTGGRALDAVEKGVRIIESDPTNASVGRGGRPDRDGRVSLDACIMNEFGDCGSVAFLENIVNPISVARMVMEKTQH